MASNSSSGSRPGVSHISLQIRKAQPRGSEKKNKQTNMDLGQLQGESVWQFSCSFPCICRLLRAFILRETSTKPGGMLTHLWLCSLTASFCWSSFLWTAISSRLVSCAQRCQLALSVSYGTFLPSSTSDLAGDLVLSLLCGFSAKTDKEIVWVAPTQTETNCYASCHNWDLYKNFEFDHINKWYMHNPESDLENEMHKILWYFGIQTDHQISARRPDLAIVKKKKEKKRDPAE